MDEPSEQMRPLLRTGLDEEALVDHGKSSFSTQSNYGGEDLESHRAVYVGVHVPLGRDSKRRHRHRGHRHHRKKRGRDFEEGKEDGRESPTNDTPSQRVQFILGTEDDDLEHVPHDLFTELDELSFRHGGATEWKETARWLKFEEDVEDGGERWSKPYVATLSLHSLFELRSCILNGTVMLDMRANSIDEIADMLIDSMVASGQLKEDLRENVREAMLKKHHHQNERKLSNRIPLVRSFADIGKKHSDPLLLERNGPLVSPNSFPNNLAGNKAVERRPSKVGVSRESSSVDFSKVDMNFMKKIPPGAEASNVLVGEVDFLEKPIIAFVRLSPAVLITGLTEVPVPTRFLFLLLGPHGKGPQYHEIGRSMATLMTDEIFHDVAYKAKDRIDLLSGIDEFLDQVTVLPPGEWDPTIRIEPPKNVPSQMKRKIPSQLNGSASPAGEQVKDEDHAGPELQRTGRICGGLVLDVKRKLPFYWSDIRDSLSLQCLASVLFLYCACMSPVITFGGLLGEATKGNISAIESLFGASLTGVAYSLFAGQPLTILGSTGPVLVFEKILFKFCVDYELSYLSLRTSIGLWTAFMCLVLVATDASSLVCYITRFTEEAFAALICIIFIYEALEKLFHLGEHYPVNTHNNLENLTMYSCQCSQPVNASDELMQKWNGTGYSPDSIPWSSLNVSMCKTLHGEFVGPACGHHGPYIPDVLFWSVILFFTTFCLSAFLKQFKTERYFHTRVRSTISDFAVFITIMVMVLVDYLMGIPSPKLNVPDRFEPTSKHRGWLMDPLGNNPWWTLLVAALPALLCTILIFMDQQITAVIINRKEHKLKKGCGYHLDLLIVAIMLGVCSIMGLPWFVAATVLSISHVNSLKVESGCSAPGEQPKFLGIREQRVTGFMIFVLMGCSVFMTSVLKFIPMPVLYGVFLYMGVSSLKGIQFFDRIKLFGMPSKHQPDLIYLRYVPLWKVHVFTLVQLTCLVLLWVIKASSAAVVFPMMVLALVFIRKLLDFFFTKRELSWLDDLMPESKKKKEDDKKKKAQENLGSSAVFTPEEESRLYKEDARELKVSFEGANLLNIPVKALSGSSDTDPLVVNISDEKEKTEELKAVNSSAESCLQPVKRSESQEKIACVRVDVSPETPGRSSPTETFL
ncbi:sodium bicarbonate cotransporter 3 isoform X11 [Gasterosteus aculeatus]|uniref:Anion exchange protein n=1 Tax=Gasterosteus aculeatus aculeatus TaxID=481459 RepID=A0AAQ4Q141_GASAC|nr:sodium bicarbonate cotransporter 3-like isoform X11 [Gasterosteus aculeatus aculeatus]